MSLRCPECGYLPENTWIDWEKAQLLSIEYSFKMQKLFETLEGVSKRDTQRLEVMESKAMLCQCESCMALVVCLRSECPISNITGNTLHHVVKFADVSLRPIEKKTSHG